jgi:hypothetical protein
VLDLRRKRGFLKLSMKHNVPLVPVFSFNETDLVYQLTYDTIQKRFPVLHYILHIYNKATGIMMPLPTGLPQFRAPIVTVVGAPILYDRKTGGMIIYDEARAASLRGDAGLAPGEEEREYSEAEVQRFSELYIEYLHKFYAEYAPKYNSTPDRKLTIYS